MNETVVGNFCDVGVYIPVNPPPREYYTQFAPGEVPGQYDRFTRETARRVLLNNNIGRGGCGW